MTSISNLFKLVVLAFVLSGCASRPVVYRAPPQSYQAPVVSVHTPVAPRVQPSISIVSQPTFEKPILLIAITAGYLESTLTHITVSNRSIAYGKKIQCESLSLCTINLLDDLQYKSVYQNTNIVMDIVLIDRVTVLKSFPIQIQVAQFMRPALHISDSSVVERLFIKPGEDPRQLTNIRVNQGLYEITDTNGGFVRICASNGGVGWVKSTNYKRIFAVKTLMTDGGCR